MPRPEQDAEHEAILHEYVVRREPCQARTSSAPAVSSIPSGSGWNIAPAFATVGRNAKNPTEATHSRRTRGPEQAREEEHDDASRDDGQAR